jgi:hypothetical protein
VALEARRSQTGQALWVVDQFEELFTLHDEETQGRFAEMMGRAAESGIHVLLSMRDDFLIRCHAHPALAPVFKDLTPVLPLQGAALRKALVEPAQASGYRFEDEALVAEILTEVSQEKGALPLLAFAASKLWEKRDREERRLTREAYLRSGASSRPSREATLASASESDRARDFPKPDDGVGTSADGLKSFTVSGPRGGERPRYSHRCPASDVVGTRGRNIHESLVRLVEAGAVADSGYGGRSSRSARQAASLG